MSVTGWATYIMSKTEFILVSYYINWVETSWPYSMYIEELLPQKKKNVLERERKRGANHETLRSQAATIKPTPIPWGPAPPPPPPPCRHAPGQRAPGTYIKW